MMRSCLTAACVLLAIVLQTAAGLACGDKFLLTSRGTKVYRSAAGSGAAAILIYARPASSASAIVINEDAAAVLRREGYEARAVQSPAALAEALRGRAWDLILTDITDAESIAAAQSTSAGASPTLLPVLASPAGRALADARARFTVAMKGPVKTQAFLNAVADVLDRRYAAMERAAKAAAKAAARK